jgi:hypothetical protein
LGIKISEIEAKIEEYLKLLDTQDAQESEVPQPKGVEMKTRLEEWKQRRQQYQNYLKQMEEKGERQITLTDPGCRKMSTDTTSTIGYNVQSAVDSKHHLIVEHEVTNVSSDRSQLAARAEKAQQTLGVETLEVVADPGYSDVIEIKKCEASGIQVYAPTQNTSANTKLGLYGKERFHYVAEKDVYRCPAEKELTFRFERVEEGRPIRYYVGVECG